MNPVIQLRGLTKRFETIEAVSDLSFDIAEGELFGLVGPDGAGKTTTLRMLAGVLRPSAGEATMNGIEVSKDPEGIKSEIAYMSQRFGLYTDLTVMENIEFYADLYRVPRSERRERLDRLFEFSGLRPFQSRLAGKLSGGMKQKLGLSCALIHMPKILLLDEPTFGVDPVSRRELWLIVHEMVDEGVTVIASTSYLDEAERFDRVAMLHEGLLIALDTPSALVDGFSGELITIRVSDVRRAREIASSLPSVQRALIFGNRLHATVGSRLRDAAGVERALVEGGLGPVTIESGEPSLEDVFVQKIALAEAR